MSSLHARPISDYGLIGNSRTAALVSADGSIDWLCLPRFDGDPLFCSLLDREIGGSFSITPLLSFRSHHSYHPGTNVLVTRFQSSHGAAELTDAFTVTDEASKRQELWPDHEILRKLQGQRGTMKFRMTFYPTRRHGLRGLELKHKPPWGVIARCRQKIFALQTNLPDHLIQVSENLDGRELVTAEFEVRAGDEFWFSLLYEDDAPATWAPLGPPADERLRKTTQYWQNWISRCRYEGPYEEQVRRSALALKLLIYAPSGAIVAAPTTSLPEWVGGHRNWDYRYCWLRDASYTVRVLVSLGYLEEAKAYVSWLLHSTRLTRSPWKTRLNVLYDVYGAPMRTERALPWLRGYRNSRPVRVGNGAGSQHQLDIYGEVIEALGIIAPFLGKIDHDTREMILDVSRAVVDLWRLPDAGMWESRAGCAHYTHSKVMAWVALTRTADLARKQGWRTRQDLGQIAEEIRSAIEEKGFNPQIGAYVQTFGGKDLDSSLLLLPNLGFCDARSSRMQGTIEAILRRLTHHGLVYRYESGLDGLSGKEGAFGICNFWMAEAMFRSGRIQEGKSWFESLLNKSGHEIGLWSEEIDPVTNEYLGNYPQAFSHIGLINAALSCQRAENSTKETAA